MPAKKASKSAAPKAAPKPKPEAEPAPAPAPKPAPKPAAPSAVHADCGGHRLRLQDGKGYKDGRYVGFCKSIEDVRDECKIAAPLENVRTRTKG